MKDYLKMLKALILIFFTAQVMQAVLARKKNTEKQPAANPSARSSQSLS